MALTDDDLKDIEQGRVTFAERIESDDFVLGQSGVSMDFFISTDHPGVNWWENIPPGISNQILSELYLQNFPWLRGQKVAVRIVAENKTSGRNRINRETFAQKDGSRLIRSWATGFTPEVAANINLMTISLVFENEYLNSFSGNVTRATLWGLRVADKGGTMPKAFLKEHSDLAREATLIIMDESGLSGSETVYVDPK